MIVVVVVIVIGIALFQKTIWLASGPSWLHTKTGQTMWESKAMQTNADHNMSIILRKQDKSKAMQAKTSQNKLTGRQKKVQKCVPEREPVG